MHYDLDSRNEKTNANNELDENQSSFTFIFNVIARLGKGIQERKHIITRD